MRKHNQSSRLDTIVVVSAAPTGHSLERLDDLEHRHPLPSPEVVDLNTVEVGVHNLMKHDSLKPAKQN